MKKQKGQAPVPCGTGQAILALILIMAVALAIGVSVIQKSLVDVSTSTKVETSQRAFSAAEAGIEKALRGSDVSEDIALENQSFAQVQDTGLLPYTADAGSTQAPLEYPPLAKEEFVHVWLADPKADLPVCSTSNVCYKQTSLDVYWGSSTSDKAALELTLVYYNGTIYQGRKWFLDHTTIRTPANNFEQVACTGYTLGSTSYQCKKTIGASPDSALPLSGLMLLRARLLYNLQSQPFAVQATGTCGSNCSLPPQARIIASKGTSGETQRILQFFQIRNVVPPYFDFAIFSAGEIRK